jgi:tetrahydromethanopterin S-methyltransferase subunit F
MNNINQAAVSMIQLTVEDLKDRLQFEKRPEVLRRALEISADGIGYGIGKTAARMIYAALKRAEKNEVKK